MGKTRIIPSAIFARRVSSFAVADAPKRDVFLGLAAPAIVAFPAFAPALSFGFVYDDHWTIEENHALALPLRTLLRATLGGRGPALRIPDATRPTMVASMWVDRRLFGDHASGFHLHSLLLYAVVTVA